MWRRTWEQCAPDIREAAKRIKAEHTPKVRAPAAGAGSSAGLCEVAALGQANDAAMPDAQITKVLAAYVQAQLKLMNKFAQALQREEYKSIELA